MRAREWLLDILLWLVFLLIILPLLAFGFLKDSEHLEASD